MERVPQSNLHAARVCMDVLRELEGDLPISSEDEWYEVRALLFDLYGHGITKHQRLKSILFSTIVNRRVERDRRPSMQPSYRSFGSGLMFRALVRDVRRG